MRIDDLGVHPEWIATIARWHFERWGRLIGADTLAQYEQRLRTAAHGTAIPSVLVARDAAGPLGSASLLACDMTVRPHLTPWLAQLFVVPDRRRAGVGAALVAAARDRAAGCGYERLYLYTSGDLPAFYARLGWAERERIDYLGTRRTVMDIRTRD